MLLLRQIIPGVEFSEELTGGALSFPVAGNFPYMVSDQVLEGWEDVSNISAWYKFRAYAKRDFKFVRKEISTLAYIKTNGFVNMENLTDIERRQVAEFFAMPFQFIVAELGSQFNKYKKEWIAKSTDARLSRWEEVKGEVLFSHLQELDAKSALVEIESASLLSLYSQGVEGSLEDNGIEGIFDYMEARPGTSWGLNGLRLKNYVTTSGLTMSQVSALVMDILKNGNYESD